MSNSNSTVRIFDAPFEIAIAIREVRNSGFETGEISAAWGDHVGQAQFAGYYRSENSMKYWGNPADPIHEILRALQGWAFCTIPDIGPVLIFGPLADWIANALANASIFGDLNPIGMGLYSIGISRQTIQQCQEALRRGQCLLLLNGPAGEVKKAMEVIKLL